MSNEPISSNDTSKYLNRKGITVLPKFFLVLLVFILISPLFLFIFIYTFSIINEQFDSKTSFLIMYPGGGNFLFLLSLGSMIWVVLALLALLPLFFSEIIGEVYFLEDSLLIKYRRIFGVKSRESEELEYSRIENTSSWVGKKIILDVRKSNREIDKQVFRVLSQVDFSLQYLFHSKVLRGKLQFEPGKLGVKIGRRGTEMAWPLALVICFISFLFYVCFKNLSYEVSDIQLILVFLVVWLPIATIVLIYISIIKVLTNHKSSLYYSPIDSALVLSDFVNGQDCYTKINLSHIISFDFNTGKNLKLVYKHWDDNFHKTEKTFNFIFSEKLSKETIEFLELLISEEGGGIG